MLPPNIQFKRLLVFLRHLKFLIFLRTGWVGFLKQSLEDFNWVIVHNTYRSSRLEVFFKKGVLRNFAKFTEKHLCQSLFFNKVAGLSPATLLKKGLWRWRFPVNFVKFLRTTFFKEDLWWLLPYISDSHIYGADIFSMTCFLMLEILQTK